MSIPPVAVPRSLFLFFVVFLSLFDETNAQVPLNGDQAAAKKMFAALVQEKAIVERDSRREEILANRAVHFMKARERFASIRNFIDRGSFFFPALEGEGGGGAPLAPIVQNANVGEQVIDPRTPTGLGNPFFRQINVEQNIVIDALMSKFEIKQVREENGNLVPEYDIGWVTVEAKGEMGTSVC